MFANFRVLIVLALVAFAVPFLPADAGAVTDEVSGGGWLGVHIQDLTEDLREVLDLDEGTDGALVAEVNEGGPADEAGVKKGDVIVRIDRKAVTGVEELVKLVKQRDPGDKVSIVVLRDGAKKKLVAVLGERPKKLREEINFDFSDSEAFSRDKDKYVFKFSPDDDGALKLMVKKGRLGVQVIDVSEELGEYFDTDEGALVIEVMEDSGAEEAGVKSGDVIIEVDGKPVEDSEDLTRLLQKREKGDDVELVLVRKGEKMKLDAVLGEGSVLAWIEGMKKGITMPHMPHLYLDKGPEGPEGGVELHMKMEALSRELEELEEELEELSEQLEALRN
jgi:C-terminal processing protease CtpA/Prc